MPDDLRTSIAKAHGETLALYKGFAPLAQGSR